MSDALRLLKDGPFANTGSWRQAKRAGKGLFDARAREGLLRTLLTVAARDARFIVAEGRSYINFASNDYLGLRFNAALMVAPSNGRDLWRRFRRLASGHRQSRPVRADRGQGRATQGKAGLPSVMASGFQTNAAVLQALFDETVLGAEPLVFADRLNHASMHFGCQAAGVRQLRYRHCDAAHLAEL